VRQPPNQNWREWDKLEAVEAYNLLCQEKEKQKNVTRRNKENFLTHTSL
jgi:hypothetical protein